MNNNTTESMGMLLTLDNPVFGCFIYWASILIIKMLLMSMLTALQRFRYKITEGEAIEFFLVNMCAKGNKLTFNASAISGVLSVCAAALRKIVALIPLAIVKKVFISPEDEAFAAGNAEVKENDEHVDRVRRAHLNDIENILPFLTMGLLFVCLNPNEILARVLFRIQGVARIMHTLVYAFRPVPQPSRAIAFFVAYFDTLFMGAYALYHTIQYI